MQISPEEVRKIAVLARLALDPSESEEIARDLESILEHMKALGELDTAQVAPMGGVSEHAAPMRDDREGADPLHLPLERVAPALIERFFTVPRLAALDGDAATVEEVSE